MNKLPIVILYVADQQRSRLFYESVLQAKPVLDVPGMTEFMLCDGFKLGLMPESGIAKLITPHAQHPSLGTGIPRCELYLMVSSPSEYLNRALSAGASRISDAMRRDWGDEVAYCSDPDGHILAFAK